MCLEHVAGHWGLARVRQLKFSVLFQSLLHVAASKRGVSIQKVTEVSIAGRSSGILRFLFRLWVKEETVFQFWLRHNVWTVVAENKALENKVIGWWYSVYLKSRKDQPPQIRYIMHKMMTVRHSWNLKRDIQTLSEVKTYHDTTLERCLEMKAFIVDMVHYTVHRRDETVGMAWGKVVLSILSLNHAVNLGWMSVFHSDGLKLSIVTANFFQNLCFVAKIHTQMCWHS